MAIIIQFSDWTQTRRRRPAEQAPRLLASWSFDPDGRPVRRWRFESSAAQPSC